MQDELRSAYDLRTLQVRKVGRGREHFGRSIHVALDGIEKFSAAISENETRD